MAEQTALPLEWRGQYSHKRYIIADCNRPAFDAVQDISSWQTNVLTIIAPGNSGKTHLARIFADKHAPVTLSSEEDIEHALSHATDLFMIDDVDQVAQNPGAQEKLFFLYNAVQEKGKKLLLTSGKAFQEWVVLPDLLSRLQAAMTVFIGDPDEATLRMTYQKLFMDRGIILDDQTLTYLSYRSERSFSFVYRLVEKMDRLSLAEKKRLTRPYVSKILDKLL